MKNPFLSLKYRNFRLFWIGMILSSIGTWMQTIALPWVTLSITNDPFKVSLVIVMQFIPTLIFTIFSGALLDKFNKKTILNIAQIGMMCVSAIFTILVFTKTYTFENIMFFSLINGIFTSLDAPSRQSMIHYLIDDDKDLPNAIALNSISFNTARILGPSLAGIIMHIFGVWVCFLLNTISFFAIIISLKFINFIEIKEPQKTFNIFKSIQDGFLYAFNKKILRELLLIILIIATFIPNFNITISAFAKFILNGSEKEYGYMMAIFGIGALCGSLCVASFGKMELKIIRFLSIFTAFALSMIGITSDFLIASITLCLTGFCFVITGSSINSTVQLNTENNYRGRVMSIYTLFFLGSTPFGALFAGYFTDKFGANFGLFICGFATILLLIMLFLSQKKYDYY